MTRRKKRQAMCCGYDIAVCAKSTASLNDEFTALATRTTAVKLSLVVLFAIIYFKEQF